MTGDVSLNPNANCIVMTTEILRSMIYRCMWCGLECLWDTGSTANAGKHQEGVPRGRPAVHGVQVRCPQGLSLQSMVYRWGRHTCLRCGGPIKRCALVWWAHQALCFGVVGSSSAVPRLHAR